MYPQNNKNIEEQEIINQLDKFVNCHREYNKDRSRTSTEKELLDRAHNFAEQYPDLNLERKEETNLRTFCAHGTNAWALFSASAFSNGQLLSRNALKLEGMVPISGESKGLSIVNRNFVSTLDLTMRSVSIGKVISYSNSATSSCRQPKAYNYLKKKYLKKYEKRSSSRFLKSDFQIIFNHPSMEAACNSLCKIPIIIIGDGIGDSGFTFNQLAPALAQTGREPSEILYKKVNIRAVAVRETDKEFVQKLIQTIHPALENTIAFLTINEIEKFEKSRKTEGENYKYPYLIDFLENFKEVKAKVKVDFFAMRPIRIDQDLFDKSYPGGSNNLAASPVLRFKAGEIVYYEQLSEETPLQVLDEICMNALRACLEVINIVNTLVKSYSDNSFYEHRISIIKIYFSEHCRFWERELNLYLYIYNESSNNLTGNIKKVHETISIVDKEIKFAEDFLNFCPKIKEFHCERGLANKDLSPRSVIFFKISELLVSFMEEIIFMNFTQNLHYAQFIKKEEVRLKFEEEPKFIQGLISLCEGYRQKCLNDLYLDDLGRNEKGYLCISKSLEKIINKEIFPKNRQVDCGEGSSRKNVKEMIESFHHFVRQYCNSVIKTVRNPTQKEEDCLYEINSNFKKFENLTDMFFELFRLISNIFFEKKLLVYLIDELATIKKILTCTKEEISQTEEKYKNPTNMFYDRNVDQEKDLILNIQEYRNQLLLSKKNTNSAKKKAESLLKILEAFKGMVNNLLTPDLISQIRSIIHQENEILGKHRHSCIFNPFFHALSIFKPKLLKNRVTSIKITANLDSYLNSLEASHRKNSLIHT